MTRTPAELVEEALAELGARVLLSESMSPASHTVVVAAGLDEPTVAPAVARYAVACLCGLVGRDASIGDRVGVTGVDQRAEVRRLVERIVVPPADLAAGALLNWRQTWRDAWIAEVFTHAVFVLRKTTASACLSGPVVALLRPHPVPKRQGLDSVVIYDEQGSAIVAVGETKASRERGSDELTHACDLFDQVDGGMYGPDLRDAIDQLGHVLPAGLAAQVSDSLWRDQRCYVPAVLHETVFNAATNRPRLAQLTPAAARKRVLVLRFSDFEGFFNGVADAMPAAVEELVV